MEELAQSFVVFGFTVDAILIESKVVDTLVGCDEIGGVGIVDKYGLDVSMCGTIIDVVREFLVKDGLSTVLSVLVS